ncbi:hypothetical protein JXA32_07285 [Candidatus Sumerlaeota bacterium]|nr:hypothetical protein [Candidatus Sumerlaeota bacterium]
MAMTQGNTALWDAVEKTDPAHTKTFSRPGGFSGTAINATWLAKRATEKFGPYGIGWGVEIVEEQYQQGGPIVLGGEVKGHQIVHIYRIKLWYKWGKERGAVPSLGQTTFVGINRNGVFTDEEAPKKSLTDAITKALSMLGFGADVHMGMFDDNKYVSDRMREEHQKKMTGQQGGPAQPQPVPQSAPPQQNAPQAQPAPQPAPPPQQPPQQPQPSPLASQEALNELSQAMSGMKPGEVKNILQHWLNKPVQDVPAEQIYQWINSNPLTIEDVQAIKAYLKSIGREVA